MRSTAARNTEEKAGRTWVLMKPLRVASSQTASTTRIGAPRDRSRSALARAFTDTVIVLEHFLSHLEPHPVSQRRELGGRDDLFPSPRPVQGDVDDALDPAGTGGHDQDALGQVDRLLHRVRDEQDRLLPVPPDAEQLVLLQLSGLGIERAEG